LVKAFMSKGLVDFFSKKIGLATHLATH